MDKLYPNYSKKHLKRMTPLFIYIVCVLAVAELSLRVIGYIQYRKPIANKISRENDYIIVCIGDSFTYGLGVEKNDSYPTQLEKLLNSNIISRHFKVFNFGVPGSNSSMHLGYFTELIRGQVRPDLVIILTGANDSWNFAKSNIEKVMQNQSAFSKLGTKIITFFADFRIYKMVKLIIVNLTRRTSESEIGRGKIVFTTKNPPGRTIDKLKEHNLTQMATLAQSSGIQLMFQNYPNPGNGNCDDTIEQKITQHFSIPFVNNCAVFFERLKTTSPHDLYIYDNCHPNAAGYAIMAQGIYKVISENILKK